MSGAFHFRGMSPQEEFATLPPAVVEDICSVLRRRRLRRHQYLLQEGGTVVDDYFVEEGLLRAYLVDETGKEHTVQFAAEGWWISDYAGYFRQARARLNVDCLEASVVHALSLADRRRLCAEHPSAQAYWAAKLEGGFVSLQSRVLEQISGDAAERYASFVERYPGFVQRLPKKLIASYLGVTRETLSRLGQGGSVR